MSQQQFDYGTAFSRNIGWVTPGEQALLRHKKIAIAGLGGVGGNHLLTLTRLGVGAFNIADFDHFDIANFNRQSGAALSTVGRSKSDVLKTLALDINPDLELRVFPEGVTEENIKDFLSGADLYIDGLDFFTVEIRRKVFAACERLKIPAITAAPLGMGCALLTFLSGRMSFEDYFQLEGQSEQEQLLRFLVGLSPARLHNGYLFYPKAVDIPNHKGPSTPMAVQLCSGAAATQALKILLRRGKTYAVPWSLHYDAYENKMVKSWRPGGNSHPLQKLSLLIARKKFSGTLLQTQAEDRQPRGTLEKVIDDARWAPSGDNTQPWRFEIINDQEIKIHIHRATNNTYEYNNGQPTLLSVGMLLECMALSAASYHLEMAYELVSQNEKWIINSRFTTDREIKTDPLSAFIRVRSVDRKPYKIKSLPLSIKNELENALGQKLKITWHETLTDKLRLTQPTMQATDIRLRLESCYKVHRNILDWDNNRSRNGIPVKSLGLDKLTLSIMKWCMQDWKRINIANRYFAATSTPKILMDLIPGVFCAAQFSIDWQENSTPSEVDYIDSGRQLYRFWLTATQHNLHLQPNLALLCFAHYAKNDSLPTSDPQLINKARKFFRNLSSNTTIHPDKTIFCGRVGYSSTNTELIRSTRKPLDELLLKPSGE